MADTGALRGFDAEVCIAGDRGQTIFGLHGVSGLSGLLRMAGPAMFNPGCGRHRRQRRNWAWNRDGTCQTFRNAGRMCGGCNLSCFKRLLAIAFTAITRAFASSRPDLLFPASLDAFMFEQRQVSALRRWGCEPAIAKAGSPGMQTSRDTRSYSQTCSRQAHLRIHRKETLT